MTATGKQTILFIPEGTILAHVSRGVEIARRLDPNANNIHFACSGPAATLIEKAGFHHTPLLTRPKEELLARLHKGQSAFTEHSLRDYVQAEIALLETLSPDVVVSDFRPSVGISARVAGIRHICVTNAVWTPYYTGPIDPPDSFILTRILGKTICRLIAPMAQSRVFRHYAAPFNAVRKAHHLPPQKDIRACMSDADLVLLADLPEFAPTADLPAHFKYIGPIVWEPDIPEPKEIQAPDKNRALVYLTLGSTGSADALPEIVGALTQQERRVVCTTGGKHISGLPKGCVAVPYANGSRLCELADVVICHGGNGTIYQALRAGTPIIGIPTFHDQEFNLQQVETLGVGISVRPGRNAADRVITALKQIDNDPRFRERAAELQKKLAPWDGPARAAQAIQATV